MIKDNYQKDELRIEETFKKIEAGEYDLDSKKRQKPKKSLGDLIVKLVQENEIYLFHDEKGDGHARIKKSGRFEIHKIRSKTFKNFISFLVWSKEKRAIYSEAMASAIATLEGIAKFEGKEHKLHLRTTWYEGALWYDLGDWRAVRIDENDWQIFEEPPILFRHFSHQKTQVEPIRGGDIKEILKFVNLKKSYYHLLFLTYLPTTLIPDIPRAILIIYGDQGAAKTTFEELIKSIIDPSGLKLPSCPRSEQDLVQLISHHYAVYFDNFSHLPEWMSDVFCRACTGAGFQKRELYTDDEDILYSYQRAIGLNGINLVVSKPDLLDRSLIFELKHIPKKERIDEKKLWKEFEEAKPKILGAIFTILSKAIGIRKEIQLDQKPRMADYALWCAACAKVMGRSAQEFLDAYEENIKSQNAEAIEASSIAQAILSFMEGTEEWKGTANELLQLLSERSGKLNSGWEKEKNWPKTSNWLWKRIKETQVNLQQIGIDVSYDKDARPRTIFLKNRKVVKSTDATDITDQVKF